MPSERCKESHCASADKSDRNGNKPFAWAWKRLNFRLRGSLAMPKGEYPSRLAFALGTTWQDHTRLIGGGTLVFGYCDEADDVVGIILAP